MDGRDRLREMAFSLGTECRRFANSQVSEDNFVIRAAKDLKGRLVLAIDQIDRMIEELIAEGGA